MRNLNIKEIVSVGASIISTGRFLWRMPHRSPEEIRLWQFTHIQKLVEHAYANVPFYTELYTAAGFKSGDLRSWDDFHTLPIVTKDMVIACYPDKMLARGVDADSLIISRSSGSSGKVLDIAYDSRAMSLFILAGLRLYQMGFNYKPWHRQLYIYTSPYPLNSLLGLYPLSFVPTLAPVPKIIDTIVAFKPALLVCYPSHLKQIAQEITTDQRHKIKLKCISVNSEMSTQKERDELSQFFGCPVLDEYSSEELTRIAAQCSHKKYHLFEDINYIETVDDSRNLTSGSGIIVGTNLHNYAMPMIRYKQNDIATLSTSSCECGWNFRQLSELQGRKNDNFIMPSGKILSSGFLLDAAYDMLLTYRDAVKDFCLIQDTENSIRLQVLQDKGWTSDVEHAVASRFKSFFEPNVRFAIEKVDVCEKTTTGKRNPIISYVGRQHG